MEKMTHKRRASKVENTGTIMEVHDMGTMWSIDVKTPSGKMKTISGDWRPMRDGLDDAFDISSSEFPYTSSKKIYENVIGQRITFTPDLIFGASGWAPLGEKAFNLKVDDKGKIHRVRA
jgi:hypothetical protein